MAKKRWLIGTVLLFLLVIGFVANTTRIPRLQPDEQQADTITNCDDNNLPIEESSADKICEPASSHPDEQIVEIMADYYFGDWLVGEVVGDGYVTDGIDPHGVAVGGILSLFENQAIFYGPKSTSILDNPEYKFILQSPPEFANIERASYGSFDFQNAYVVRMDIYDGDTLWAPEGLWPIWIKDINTMIVRHHTFHVLNRVEPFPPG